MGFARFYLPEFTAGNYSFTQEEIRHIAGSKRLRSGDIIEVFDGIGSYQEVKIIALKSRKVEVEPVADIKNFPRQPVRVEIAVAVPKGKRLQYMIEKLTELGVQKVSPVVFKRSVAGGDDPVDRYQRWAIEACKQSRNLWLPVFSKPAKLCDYLENIESTLFMADFTGSNLYQVLAGSDSCMNSSICLVGPEGGFDEDEFAMVAKFGGQKVKLASNILRIETAAVAFASAIMAFKQ